MPYHCRLNTKNHHTTVLQTKQVSIKIFTPQCCKHKSVKIVTPQHCKQHKYFISVNICTPQSCKCNRSLSKSSHHITANTTGVRQHLYTTVMQHNTSLSKSSHHSAANTTGICQNVHTTVLQTQEESLKNSSNHLLIRTKPCHCQENVDKSFEK